LPPFVPNQFDLNFGSDVDFLGLLATVAPLLAGLASNFPDRDSTAPAFLFHYFRAHLEWPILTGWPRR